jgi:2',3'-cyclic-nucleotide 2'-phosphodiesterase (5'-nucleotidase family)
MTRNIGIALRALVACAILIASPGYAATAESVSASPLENKDPGTSETAIGSFVADAFRAEMHTDISFVAAGDLKVTSVPLPAGKVQSDQIASLLAYPNDNLAVLALDGRTIREALERSVSGYPRAGLSFLQVSGLKWVFDPARPVGDRVTSISVGEVPIAPEKGYTVAVMSSLADGALGYWKVWSKRNVISRSQSLSGAVAVQMFMTANPKIDYSALNRISVAK